MEKYHVPEKLSNVLSKLHHSIRAQQHIPQQQRLKARQQRRAAVMITRTMMKARRKILQTRGGGGLGGSNFELYEPIIGIY